MNGVRELPFLRLLAAAGLVLVLGQGCDEDAQLADAWSPADLGGGEAYVTDAPLPLLEGGPDGFLIPDLPPSPDTGKMDQGHADQGQPGSGTCVPDLSCTTTADCTAKGVLDCVNGSCVYCKTDGDCPSGSKGCDTSTGFCRVICVTDADCTIGGVTVGTGKCDTQIWNCTLCASDADCASVGSGAGFTKYCAQIPNALGGTLNMCVGCKSDADCANTNFKGCDTVTGTCKLCKSVADCCPFSSSCGQTCDANGECRCTSDQQCHSGYGLKLWKCQ